MQLPFRFEPPRPSSDTLLRPRLLVEVARRWRYRAVFIEAGAGIGKTTLLSQAIAENRLDSQGRDVWLSCEPGDSSPSVLFGALLQGLGRASDERREPGVDDVCNAVWSMAPAQICLVLDDVHALQAGCDSEAALGDLIDQLPGNGHVVIAGRRLAGLPVARLVSRRQALYIDERRLCFDRDDEQRFAAARGVAPSLFEGIGGWPAMAELRATSSVALAEQFLRDELLSALTPEQASSLVLAVLR